MIEFLNENTLNENIPPDLLRAYKKINTKYNSQRREDDYHYNVGGQKGRRRLNYAYGSATYKEVTVEEALALIRQDPYNVDKIRGILAGELVEYEYQNGKFYNVYANPDRAVSYTKPNGEVVTKRNIRYIANPKIWLPLLDKIYVTDEYDYRIDDAEREARNQKSDLVGVASFEPGNDPEYSQFRPFSHLTRHVKAIRHKTPDTGDHNSDPLIPNGYINLTGSDALNDKTLVHLSPEISRTYNEYLKIKKEKNELFNNYDRYRKALRKLRRDRDDYDEDEYTELLDLWTAKEQQALKDYEESALKFDRLKNSLRKYLQSAGNDFSAKFAAATRGLETVLKKCLELKQKIDRLKATSVDDLNRNDFDNDSEVTNLLSRIKTLSNDLQLVIDKIAELKRRVEDGADDSTETATTIEQLTALVSIRAQALRDIRTSVLTSYLEKYKELHAQMLEIEDKVNELKPTRAAKKARARAAAGQATLDPALSNIIQFVDDFEDHPEDSEQPA